MSVQPISALLSPEPNLYAAKRNDELGKHEFLRLLITQIQQQDPLNPQDPAEFTAQLTQFGNLEQLISLNQAIQDLQLLQLSSNNTQAAALIGKNVLYDGGGSVEISGGRPGAMYLSAPAGAISASATIRNASGQVIRTLHLGSLNAGIQDIEWDGLDDSGNPLVDGNYSFTLAASDVQGNSLQIAALSEGRVRGVSFENGVLFADVGNRRINLSNIYSIRESGSI